MKPLPCFSQKVILVIVALMFGQCSISTLKAQILNPVKWKFSSTKISTNEVQLVFEANIDKGWHLFSQFLADGGPLPTKFTIEKSKNFQEEGQVTEGKPEKIHDDTFGMDVFYFEGLVRFRQKVKISSLKSFEIKAKVEYQACNDSRCLPGEEEFVFKLEGVASPEGIKRTSTRDSLSNLRSKDSSGLRSKDSSGLKEASQIAESDSGQANARSNSGSGSNAILVSSAPITTAEHSSWGIFIAGFIGGLIALLTPCVFPMIPLTVSFFTKKTKTRKNGVVNAIIYGLSIITIYVSLGLIITFIFGPDALNALASNVVMNLVFFVIFVVFAISFLGAFEITLPSSWVNKADNASDKGGLAGIFFMAFTLSLVSFSCTGPIIGTLLVETAGGGLLNPAIGMAGFSSALALPFALFAAFPGWLHSLPKSGGWLNTIKVVLGFLELALALKFFSNVDMAYHWGFLKREVFIALWIVIFSLMGLYLLGKLKFSHDSTEPFISIPRVLLAIVTFSFVVYLIPGMWGAPLKLISGFPPPVFYNEGWNMNTSGGLETKMIEGVNTKDCPYNLSCFHDYDKALAYSRLVKKPLFVDFTGHTCTNCRKMEEDVWGDPIVLKILREDYVLVSLFVDDKIELPVVEQKLSAATGKKIRTVGNKWSDLQIARFKTNSQPLYVLLDQHERELISPIGYTPHIEDYLKYLEMGKEEFGKRQGK